MVLMLGLVLAQRAQALPIVDRLVQNVFEPDRLNRWFTLWEKVIHLAKFHIHLVPRILLMPFSNIHSVHGRVKDIRRGMSDVPLSGLLGRVQTFAGFDDGGGGAVTGRNYIVTEPPITVKKAAQSPKPQPSAVRAKQ